MRILILVSAMILAGCGGRVANPIALNKSFDGELSCAHLAGELDVNAKRLVELTGESKDKPIHNLGMMLSSPLFHDLSPTQKNEAAALVARNDRLNALAKNKACELPIPSPSADETEMSEAVAE